MEEDEGRKRAKTVKQPVTIHIPSYEEVVGSSQRKTVQTLFSPSPTFSQKFSFIKNSEFYTPPSSSSNPLPAQTSDSVLSGSIKSLSDRQQAAQPGLPSSSSSAASSSYSVQNRNTILVSHKQKGNPLLKHIRNVRWNFADIVCDYLLGQNSCALYISLWYHLLHPDYLYYRIRELQKNFKLRVVLCHVDVEDVIKPLLEVTRTTLLHDCTLLCGWSLEECGRYLETIKVYENKPADIIQGQMDADYLSRLTHALTSIRHVNKTDVVTLGSTFGSLSHVMDASMEDLARCPGIGERKVRRLYDTFHEPFKRVPSNRAVAPIHENSEPCPSTRRSEFESKPERRSTPKKDPQISIRSALSAALSKHSKLGRRKIGAQVEEHTSEPGRASVSARFEGPCLDNITKTSPNI